MAKRNQWIDFPEMANTESLSVPHYQFAQSWLPSPWVVVVEHCWCCAVLPVLFLSSPAADSSLLCPAAAFYTTQTSSLQLTTPALQKCRYHGNILPVTKKNKTFVHFHPMVNIKIKFTFCNVIIFLVNQCCMQVKQIQNFNIESLIILRWLKLSEQLSKMQTNIHSTKHTVMEHQLGYICSIECTPGT